MRKALILSVAVTALATAGFAQSDDDYKTWMKSVPPAVAAVGKAADNAEAKADATKLADTFDKMAGFWKARNVSDATTLAEKARDAAKSIADGKGDKAANIMEIRTTCGACHMAHRGGSAPDYTIK